MVQARLISLMEAKATKTALLYQLSITLKSASLQRLVLEHSQLGHEGST